MGKLTKEEKSYIIKDMLSSLNSVVHECDYISLKNINTALENRKFDLPTSEIKMIVSIIKKLKAVA